MIQQTRIARVLSIAVPLNVDGGGANEATTHLNLNPSLNNPE
jgi:hypothetical protein